MIPDKRDRSSAKDKRAGRVREPWWSGICIRKNEDRDTVKSYPRWCRRYDRWTNFASIKDRSIKRVIFSIVQDRQVFAKNLQFIWSSSYTKNEKKIRIVFSRVLPVRGSDSGEEKGKKDKRWKVVGLEKEPSICICKGTRTVSMERCDIVETYREIYLRRFEWSDMIVEWILIGSKDLFERAIFRGGFR